MASLMLFSFAACAAPAEEAPAEDTPASEAPAEEGGEEAAPAAASELDLYVYYADANVATVDATLASLATIYPDLTINIEHRTDSDGAVLKTRAAVGELPDMMEVSGTLVDVFSESDDLVVLNDAAEEFGLFDMFNEGAFDAKVSADGNYYVLRPHVPEAALMFYNIEVFETYGLEVPKNYDEFKVVVETLASNDIIPLALFAQQKWPGLQMYDQAIIGSGEPLGLMGLEDGTTSITDEAYVSAANKISELVSLGLIGSGALNTNASQAFELIGTNQAGMLVNGAWFFNDAAAGGYADNIGYFEYNPFTDAGNEEATHFTISGGMGEPGGWGVSAKSENAAFATEVLMDYIVEYEKAKAVNGGMTVLVDAPAPTTPRAASYDQYINNLANIESTSKYEWSLTSQELIVALEDQSELLLTGTYQAADFITDLEEMIADALAE